MSKSGSPLNNPSPGPVSRSQEYIPGESVTGVTGKKGVAGGENPPGGVKSYHKPALVYALCLCPKCGGYNQIIYRYGRMLEYSKCNVCGELVPTEGYQVKAYGSEGFRAVYVARLESRRKQLAERVF